MYLSVVPPNLISALWPKAAPFLCAALMSGGANYYDMSDIRAFVDQGKMTLWVLVGDECGVAGAGTTEIVQYPKRRVASVVLFGADPGLKDTWLPKLEAVERWASEMGCADLKIGGRMGWKPLLPEYRVVGIILVKELKNDAKLVVAG